MFGAVALSVVVATATPAPVELATKLATVLANIGGQNTAKVYVGALPPKIPKNVVLPAFTIIGSTFETPKDLGPLAVTPSSGTYWLQVQPSSTIFYEIRGDVDKALSAYEHQLVTRGWRRFSPMPFFAYADSSKANRFYCSSNGVLLILRSRSLPNDIGIAASNFSGASMWCDAVTSAPVPPSPPPFPNLHAPANARVGEDVMGVTTVGTSEQALVTAQPIGVAGHALAAQLVAKGWKADEPGQSATAYTQTFRRERHGLDYQIVLSLIRTGSHRYALYLSESLLEGPPASVP